MPRKVLPKMEKFQSVWSLAKIGRIIMEAGNHLNDLLQHHLASDLSAVRCLPYVFLSLTSTCFLPSPHLTKWVSRLHSLQHSKESGARWAGLCLAYKTSLLSQRIMIEAAQSWLGVALAVLSRGESIPSLKAAIRLLRVILTTAIDKPEFQRQVSTPNAIKSTNALIGLLNNQMDNELEILTLETLTQLVTLYPTTHRASHSALSALALRYLNGSAASPTKSEILVAASQLYAVLHLTGGKVGATNLWRKAVDDTLAFGWQSLSAIRTTFPSEGFNIPPSSTAADDLLLFVPLNLDRLRCTITVLQSLLSTVTQRPVQAPVGSLVNFCSKLLSRSTTEMIDGYVHPFIRSMEVAVVPIIYELGCHLLICLSERFGPHLDPHALRLSSLLAIRLEEGPGSSERLVLLRSLNSVLTNCHPLDSTIVVNRLAKGVLPSLSILFSTLNDTSGVANEPLASTSRKGKKRARNYEGGEVFQDTQKPAFATDAEGEIALMSIEVLQQLFLNPHLSSALQSTIARTVMSAILSLPRRYTKSLSPNLRLRHTLYKRLSSFAAIIGSGTSNVMSKTLPFVLQEALAGGDETIQSQFEILLHPRLPPLVRTMPHLESLHLLQKESQLQNGDGAFSSKDARSSQTLEFSEGQNSQLPVNAWVPPPPPQITDPPPVKPEIQDINSATVIPTPQERMSASAQVESNRQPNSTVMPPPTRRSALDRQPVNVIASEDEDEEMPAIDVNSDSSDEEMDD